MSEYTRHHNYDVDLNRPLKRHFSGVLLATDDVEADEFIFTLTRGAAAFTSQANPYFEAYFLRSDDKTVKFIGKQNPDGTVSVVLPAECYEKDGRFTLSVKMTGHPVNNTTLAVIDGYVRKTKTDDVINAAVLSAANVINE